MSLDKTENFESPSLFLPTEATLPHMCEEIILPLLVITSPEAVTLQEDAYSLQYLLLHSFLLLEP